MKFNVLNRKISITKKIDDFLNRVSESGLLFLKGIEAYLDERHDIFQKYIEEIVDTEHRGDALRRSIEEQLYAQTLIPESRGDVLELLENMDALLDRFKGALWRFDIEQPDIRPEFHQDFKELNNCVVECVEAMVRSSRAFFNDIASVNDHLHKVIYWEKEGDRTSTRLQKMVFRRNDLDLCHKNQLRDLIRHVDKIADRAEDVADRLSIFVIKRSL